MENIINQQTILFISLKHSCFTENHIVKIT
jgi:hypothetical protein